MAPVGRRGPGRMVVQSRRPQGLGTAPDAEPDAAEHLLLAADDTPDAVLPCLHPRLNCAL